MRTRTLAAAPAVSIILAAALLLTAPPRAVDAHGAIPAIYVFGDSLVDVGNNNYLPGTAFSKGNYPHYGIDYPGGVPTGRFCNGYLATDYLAMMLGFRESPPAVLSLTNAAQELGGVNYASGGSGVFDTTNPNVSLPMDTQIKYFRRSTRRLVAAKGKAAGGLFLSKSFFFISSGSNDIFAYFSKFGPTNSTQKDQFISLLTTQYAEQLKRIYGLGARKFAVFGTTPIGCAPAFRRLNPSGGCIEDLNDLSQRLSKAVKKELRGLSAKCKGIKYAYFNMNEAVETILADPLKFGFKETTIACCGNGRFNGETPCLPNATLCANRNEYFLWDWAHPSQAAYKLLAKYAYDGSSKFVIPINFEKLAWS